MQKLLDAPQTSPVALNNLAFTWATDARTTPAQLNAAYLAITHALQNAPASSAMQAAFQDTLATVLARRGDSAAAIDAERRALAQSTDAAFSSSDLLYILRLAQLLQTHPMPPATTPTNRWQWQTDGVLQLQSADLPPGTEICALLRRAGTPFAALYVRLGPGPVPAQLTLPSALLQHTPQDIVETLLLAPGSGPLPPQPRWGVVPWLHD